MKIVKFLGLIVCLLREKQKTATIHPMNDEHELTPESEALEAELEAADDELEAYDESEAANLEMPADAEPDAADGMALPTDGMDIDAALAAVSRLDEIATGPQSDVSEVSEVDDISDTDVEDDYEADVHDDDLPEADIAPYEDEVFDDATDTVVEDDLEVYPAQVIDRGDFPAPPMMKLQRGQAASVIPALVLIIVGGWLTLTLTTTEATLDPLLMVLLIVGGVGIVFLSQWFTSRRWSSGNFFAGSLVILSGAVLFYLLQPNSLTLANGYPLLIVSVGAALLLTGIFSPTSHPRIRVLGIIVGLAGVAGLFLTAGSVEGTILNTVASLAPVLLVAVLIVLLIPFLRRN